MYKVQFGRWLVVACWLGLQTTQVNESLLAFPPSLPSAHLLTRDREKFGHKPPNVWVGNKQIYSLFQASGFIRGDNPKSKNQNPKSIDQSRPTQPSKCPADVKTLTSWLLKDLPSYANRVLRQARRLDRKNNGGSYVVLAGNPEFEPLTLGPGQYNPPTSAPDLEPPQQVFLTTLERQYIGGKAIESQHYHWLFLTQTPEGWRLAMIFSQIGSSLPGRAPTPPRESSNGVIGQAVTIWLRDCRAGGIRPPRVSVQYSRTSTEKG